MYVHADARGPVWVENSCVVPSLYVGAGDKIRYSGVHGHVQVENSCKPSLYVGAGDWGSGQVLRCTWTCLGGEQLYTQSLCACWGSGQVLRCTWTCLGGKELYDQPLCGYWGSDQVLTFA